MSAPIRSRPSPARLAANRANARKSTGPRTEGGKARSRANAVKHGLAGAGVALPSEDAAAVQARFLRMQEEFAPTTQLGMDLVHDIATCAVRRDRCRRFLAARLRRLERTATGDFEAARVELADRLVAAIEANPRASRRQLLTMPEGIDRLVEELTMLLTELAGPNPTWSEAHHQRLDALFGYKRLDLPWGRPTRFSRAVLGDFEAVGAHEYAGLPEGLSREAWAEGRLIEAIAAEVESLGARRATLDLDLIAEDRADAVDLAAFDPDRDAELARRYEATAARERSRALRDFALAESFGGSDEDNSGPGNDIGAKLGSFGAEEGNSADGPDIVAVGEPPRDPGHLPGGLNPSPEDEMDSDLGSFGAEAGCHAVRYPEPVPSDAAEPPARVRGAEACGTPPSPPPDADGEPARREQPLLAPDDPNSLPDEDKRSELGSFGVESSAAPAPAPPAEISPARAALRAAIFDEESTFIPPLDR